MYDNGIKRIKDGKITVDGILWYQGDSNATTCVAPDTPTDRDYQLETLRALVSELSSLFPASRSSSAALAKEDGVGGLLQRRRAHGHADMYALRHHALASGMRPGSENLQKPSAAHNALNRETNPGRT